MLLHFTHKATLREKMGCTDRGAAVLEDLRRAGVIGTKREVITARCAFFLPLVYKYFYEREERRLKEYKAILAGREG